MVIVFICLIILVFSFNFFVMSYQINGINRLMIAMPISFYETSINFLNIDESVGPGFDKDTLESHIKSYFAYSMERYMSDYKLKFYYYNPFDHSICLSLYCPAVEVELKANLILNYRYVKTMHYEIRSN